jgi:hypothetical protein
VTPAGLESLTVESIVAEARRDTGLEDLGNNWFLEPLRRLLDATRTEAGLNDKGVVLQRRRAVRALVNRLRMIESIRRHPEILAEDVKVAAVIVGLPRTGSTMFQRILSNAPGINTIRWWELQSYSPFPEEIPGKPDARRAAATEILKDFMDADMLAMHPFDIDAPDEEIILIDQYFVGTGPEAIAYVPTYAQWLSGFDHRPVYREIRTILQFLQWQTPERRGKRWMLKSPGHMGVLDALLDVFPEALVVSNHRDPMQTVPSWCSMICSLHGMVTAELDNVKVGRFTEKRLAAALDRYIATRDRIGAGHFTDIRYEDLLRAPLHEASVVLDRLGMQMTPECEGAMKTWLAENDRDRRASHHYDLPMFGLSEEVIASDFAAYRQRFVQPR